MEVSLRTVGDVAVADLEHLIDLVGSRAVELQQMARGLDDRPVVTEHERKSVGAENTFPRDLADGPELHAELERIAREVARRVAGSGVMARTVVLKLRYSNFRSITRQMSRTQPTDNVDEIIESALALLRGVVKEGDRFRLLGVHCTNLIGRPQDESGQLQLWKDREGAG
jgi:DNA polymerase-4